MTHRSVKHIIRLLLILPALSALQGCFFTGVESTPRITGRDVKREVTPLTAEDTYLASVSDAPLSAWEHGKQFKVTDARISRIFGATAPAESLAGQVITFDSATESAGVTGGTVTDLAFLTPEGRRLVYRINKPMERLLTDSVTEIPFTIQLSVIDRARELMEGKEFYILSSSWRDDADTPVAGFKFIPVVIDSVRPGNALSPIKVAFTDRDGHSARIFIHPGVKGNAPRTFSRVFSFTDPRLRYQHIPPEQWQLIIAGRVTEGMTTEACRLALGTPKEVERGATNSVIREAWLYENGVYLLFEDGLLKRFRH